MTNESGITHSWNVQVPVSLNLYLGVEELYTYTKDKMPKKQSLILQGMFMDFCSAYFKYTNL